MRDDKRRQEAVEAARELIYNDGYAVNSAKVEALLSSESLVPTRVSWLVDATGWVLH